MMAFRVAQRRGVPYFDTLLDPQLYREDRLWEPEKVMRDFMGDSPDTGDDIWTPGGASPASAVRPNRSQACRRRAERSFPVRSVEFVFELKQLPRALLFVKVRVDEQALLHHDRH